MRITVLAGVVLIALGGWVLLRGLSYPTEHNTLRMGQFEATFEQRRKVPAWVGGLVLAAGVALVARGARRRPGDRTGP